MLARLARHALLISIVPGLLAAQGFGIYEQDACTMGRGGAAAAAPCEDGSAIFFNPAGLAGLKGGHASAGATFISVSGGFTDDLFQQTNSLNDPLLVIPHAYVTYAVTPKLGVGLGVFAPYGLETRWPLSFDGRFAGYDNSIRTLYIQPTAAYQATPWLRVGAGVDIVHGNVALHQRLDLSLTPVPLAGVPANTTFGQFGIPYGTDFADADLEASATKVTGHFGAIAKVNDRLSVGLHYLMKVTLDYSGTASFTQVPTGIVIPASLTVGALTIPAGTPVDLLLSTQLGVFTSPNGLLANQTAMTSIANPDMLVAGVAFKPRGDLLLLADYQWVNWSSFNTLQLTFTNALLNQAIPESYQNTSGFRFGAEWTRGDKTTVRLGYTRHGAAAPDQTVTPILPEGERNEFSAGVTVKLAPQVTAAIAYQYIHQDDRRGRTREPLPGVDPATLTDGLYTFSANLVGVSFAVAF